MTVANDRPRKSRHNAIAAAVLGVAWVAATALVAWPDPMLFAFAGLLGATVLLPLAERPLDYAVAAGIVMIAVALRASPGAATVVAAYAFGLWGGVAILRTVRVDARFAVMLVIAASIALLTWPIWAANLLLRFESQRLVDWLAWTGPLFAINRAIDPTDAFTHRPWSYRWMNLGQDVPYALPATVWPCVLVHAALGVVGWIGRRGTRMQANERATDRAVE